jgi:hypothetical protein
MIEAALKPFQVLEALGLPAQYERSFKIEPGRLIAQRFMLGVRTEWASNDRLMEAARQIGMPSSAQPVFEQMLTGASAVLFGFEGSDSGDGAVFKVYTEHRSRLADREVGDPPVELFRGFKWHARQPQACVQTVYWCRPGLPIEAIRARMREQLAASELTVLHEAVAAMVDRAIASRPGFIPQWVELGEPGEPIRAFDLNLYEASLRVAAIDTWLAKLAQAVRVDRALLVRLLNAAGPGLLGHVSAGVSRRGEGFLTVYFEPAESAPPVTSG